MRMNQFSELSEASKRSIFSLLLDLRAEESDREIRQLAQQGANLSPSERQKLISVIGNGGRKRQKTINSPQRPKNAYLFFVEKNRPLMRESGLSHKESLMECSVRWRGMSEDDKRPYQLLADNGRVRYEKEMEMHDLKMRTAKHLKNLAKKLEQELVDILNDCISPEIEAKMNIFERSLCVDHRAEKKENSTQKITDIPYHCIPEAMCQMIRESYQDRDTLKEMKERVTRALKALARASHMSETQRAAAEKVSQQECIHKE